MLVLILHDLKHAPVADPGIFTGGRQPRRVGRVLTNFRSNYVLKKKLYAKMKESGAPAPWIRQCAQLCFFFLLNCSFPSVCSDNVARCARC